MTAPCLQRQRQQGAHFQAAVKEVHNPKELVLVRGRVLGAEAQHRALAPVAELADAVELWAVVRA